MGRATTPGNSVSIAMNGYSATHSRITSISSSKLSAHTCRITSVVVVALRAQKQRKWKQDNNNNNNNKEQRTKNNQQDKHTRTKPAVQKVSSGELIICVCVFHSLALSRPLSRTASRVRSRRLHSLVVIYRTAWQQVTPRTPTQSEVSVCPFCSKS
jgi:hypothetical protein